MVFNRKFCGACCVVLISSALYAKSDPLDVCPKAQEIKAQGITKINKSSKGVYIGYHVGSYASNGMWASQIFPIWADDKVQALSIANQKLEHLIGPVDAHVFDRTQAVYCDYKIASEPRVFVVATNDKDAISQTDFSPLLVGKSRAGSS